MQLFIDGQSRQTDTLLPGECSLGPNCSLAIFLSSFIQFIYKESMDVGKNMLITFSPEEEEYIKDLARPLLKHPCSLQTESDEYYEKILFYNALRAAISAVPLDWTATMMIVTYIQTTGSKTGGHRLGIYYHTFPTYVHVGEPGKSEALTTGNHFSIYDPATTMRV